MISVVIPVHKPKLWVFEKCLQYLSTQQYVSEILVVENPALTSEIQELTLKYNGTHFNSDLGANNARNTGVYHARNNIIALVDDDCLVLPKWSTEIVKAIEDNKYDCVGGRVELCMDNFLHLPKYIDLFFKWHLAHVDYDNEFGKLLYDQHIVSANLAFTKEIYEKVGGFNSNLGYFGRNCIPNDEILFVRDCQTFGKVAYNRRQHVLHMLPEERVTKKYLCQKLYGQGYADVLLKRECEENTNIFNVQNHEYWYKVAETFFDEEKEKNEWLRLYNITNLCYNIGQQHASQNIEPCQNISSLLLEELDLRY